MKFSVIPVFASLLALASATTASAHHGQDFFLLDDTRVPAFGHGIANGTFSYEDEGDDDTLSYSPGLLLGLLPRTALSLQADFSDEANSGWDYRSIQPGFHFDLTPPEMKLPVRFGLSVGYQFAETPDEHEHEHGAEEHAHDDGDNHEHGAVEEEEEGHHEHSGIHNHDDSLFTARLILEADLTPTTLLVANLINVSPEGKSPAWGYGLGIRQKLRPDFSIGVETIGDFQSHGEHEVVGAVYWEPITHFILKAGVGTGITSVGPDGTFRTGFVWLF